MSSTDLLKGIRDDVVQCTQCDLHKTRTYPVVGSGNHNADIMFVGEEPGEHEDKKAYPFAGPAGIVLDEMLSSIGMKRTEVYLCNTVKCMPMKDTKATEEQKLECLSYLTRQIEAIKPKVIVCFGNRAIKTVMSYFGLEDQVVPINRIHGTFFKVESDLFIGEIVPFFHPAAVLHNPPLGYELRQDFKKLKAAIGKSVSSRRDPAREASSSSS